MCVYCVLSRKIKTPFSSKAHSSANRSMGIKMCKEIRARTQMMVWEGCSTRELGTARNEEPQSPINARLEAQFHTSAVKCGQRSPVERNTYRTRSLLPGQWACWRIMSLGPESPVVRRLCANVNRGEESRKKQENVHVHPFCIIQTKIAQEQAYGQGEGCHHGTN